jgi:phage shock protein E
MGILDWFKDKKEKNEPAEIIDSEVVEESVEDTFNLSPEQFKEALTGDAQLVDVRRQEEFDSGHIKGAVLVPVQELSQEALDAAKVVKEKKVLLYCRSGSRSAHAGHHMKVMGYNVQHLDGGILAWKEKGFSVE